MLVHVLAQSVAVWAPSEVVQVPLELMAAPLVEGWQKSQVGVVGAGYGGKIEDKSSGASALVEAEDVTFVFELVVVVALFAYVKVG